MKLSQMTTEQITACLCRIAPALENIAMDEKINECFKRVAKKEESARSNVQRCAVMLSTFASLLLDKHKDDTFAVLAAINGKTAEEIRAQNGMQTIREVKDALSDLELMDFFTSFINMGEKK